MAWCAAPISSAALRSLPGASHGKPRRCQLHAGGDHSHRSPRGGQPRRHDPLHVADSHTAVSRVWSHPSGEQRLLRTVRPPFVRDQHRWSEDQIPGGRGGILAVPASGGGGHSDVVACYQDLSWLGVLESLNGQKGRSSENPERLWTATSGDHHHLSCSYPATRGWINTFILILWWCPSLRVARQVTSLKTMLERERQEKEGLKRDLEARQRVQDVGDQSLDQLAP